MFTINVNHEYVVRNEKGYEILCCYIYFPYRNNNNNTKDEVTPTQCS